MENTFFQSPVPL